MHAATLLLALLPPAVLGPVASEEPRAVVLLVAPGAEPDAALHELLESRFGPVAVESTRPWGLRAVVVIDSPGALPSGGPAPARGVNFPVVLVGGAVQAGVERWGLLGAAPGTPLGPARGTGHPLLGEDVALPLEARALRRGHTPLAFPLDGAPEIGVVARAEDEAGRPVAVVWHQGRVVCFGLGGDVDALGARWRSLLLDCVEFAAQFDRYTHGEPLVADLPGAGAPAALRHAAVAEPFRSGHVRELLGPELHEHAESRAAFDEWYASAADSLGLGDDGRLRVDRDLAALGLPPGHPDFVETLVDDLVGSDLVARGRAGRLLARYTARGPGRDASHAEWTAWRERLADRLVYVPAVQQWIEDDGRPPWERTETAWRRREAELAPASLDDALAVLLGPDAPTRAAVDRIVWRHGAALSEPLFDAFCTRRKPTNRIAILERLAALGPDAEPVAERLFAWYAAHGEYPDTVLEVLAGCEPRHARSVVELAWMPMTKERRDHALSRFARRGDADAFAVLAGALRRPDVVYHFDATGAFLLALQVGARGRRLDARTLDVLDALAADLEAGRSEVDALELGELLAIVGDPRHLPAVLAWADGDVPGVASRRRAVLGRVGGFGVPGYEALLARLDGAEGAWRTAVQRGLAGSPVFRAALLEYVADRDRFTEFSGALGHLRYEVARRTGAVGELALGEDEVLAIRALALLEHADSRGTTFLAEVLDHPSAWRRREAAFQLGNPGLEGQAAQGALARALDDPDPWVRRLAAWSLRRPDRDADPAVLAALDRAASGGDAAAAFIARDAHRRRTVAPGALLVTLLGSRPAMVLGVPADAPVGEALRALDAAERSERTIAARTVAERSAPLLRMARHALDPLTRAWADERIRRAEHELRAWIDDLAWDYQVWPEPAAGHVLRSLFDASRPALERFAASDQPYVPQDLAPVLERAGPRGWSVLVSGLWSGRADDCAALLPRWAELGPAADRAAPFVAMRFADRAALGDFDRRVPDASAAADSYWAPLFRSLGPAGVEALDELRDHPDPEVAAAAEQVIAAL